MTDWVVRKERTPDSGHHRFWVLRYKGRRVATYLRWESACRHIQTAHDRFGL